MDKREIEIVPGDGNLEISPAQDNVSEKIINRKPKKEDIIIPKISKKKDK